MSLPESWIQTTVRAVVEDLQPGFAQKPGEEDEGTTPQIRTHNVTPDGKISLEGIKHITANEKETARYSLAVGDVVFNNTNSEEWVGKTAVFDQEGEYVFSNHMTRLRARRDLVCPEYLAGYLQLLWSMGYAKTRAKRWVSQAGIETDTLSSFKIPLPTLPEQQQIVDVLRRAEVVAKLRHDFDELLTRTKRQLFVEMFGDPHPKFHSRWPVVKLGKFVTVATGGTPPREQADSYGKAHAWVKSTDLKDGLIATTEERVSELGIQRSNAKLHPPQTVMLAMYGQGQTRGRTGKLLIDAACNQACAALLPSYELLPDYLWVWLQLSYDTVRALGRGGQQENLNLDIVRGIQLPKPPVTLQQEFAKRLAGLLDLFKQSQTASEKFAAILEVLRIEALTGDATVAWRERNSDQIAEAAQTRDALLLKHGTKVSQASTGKITVPAKTGLPVRPARQWLYAELSEFQRCVVRGFIRYQLHPVFTEDTSDFAAFCDSDAIRDALDGLEWSPNQVGRALGVLADLGLIAQVSILRRDVATNSDTFHKAFRPLRDDECTRLADIATLKRMSRFGDVASVAYHFRAFLDHETSERAGAGGMFQVTSLEDDDGNSRTDWIDQGRHYADLETLRDEIAERLGVAPNLVSVEEIA